MSSFRSSVIALGVAAIGLLMLCGCAASSGVGTASELPGGEGPLQWSSPPAMEIDPSRSYQAVFHTEVGDVTAHLFEDVCPMTVNNFVFLARQGYFDETTFHRVLPGFMAQGGDPTGTGKGGPGYAFEDEFDPTLRFDRPGLLAMANRGPDTNGGQFFITYAAVPHLNDLHTIFGEVVEGMDVLASLTPRDPQSNPDFPGTRLISVEIIEGDS